MASHFCYFNTEQLRQRHRVDEMQHPVGRLDVAGGHPHLTVDDDVGAVGGEGNRLAASMSAIAVIMLVGDLPLGCTICVSCR